jgi:hypothetical protein
MDGSIYNIADYQQLADFFKDTLGSYNYFGGDGTTTFAVPDARGEFMRGYDPSGLRDQNGGATRGIGKHQDGTTEFASGISSNGSAYGGLGMGTITSLPSGYDKQVSSGALRWWGTTNNGSGQGYNYTARPTNINVLYCIKYEATYYAVNQYGGFESKVLWEGQTQSVINIPELSKYDYILIFVSLSSGNSSQNVILTKDSNLNQPFYCNGTNYILFKIDTDFINGIITSTITTNISAWATTSFIKKIIGYKGTLPTLLSGGVF